MPENKSQDTAWNGSTMWTYGPLVVGVPFCLWLLYLLVFK